jgi:hypothetical protein
MADSLAREITRRGFLVQIGQGLAAPNVAGTFIHNTAAQQFVPDPPGKKLGWAIVGLGSLSMPVPTGILWGGAEAAPPV